MGRFRLRKRVVEAPEPDPFFPVPSRFNFTRDVVEAAAAADGFRHAMTFVDHEGIIDRRTFREIANDASRWTSLFRSRGLKPGDRIVVLVGRTPLWHSVILGALKGGFVAVPCPPTFDPDELMQRSAHCDARAVVTDRAHAPSLAESAGTDTPPEGLLVVEDLKEELRGLPVTERTHDTAADDPAFILYTSGTTGAPKGAIHTHASTWTMRLQAEHWLDVRPSDLAWCTADVGSALFVWNSLIGPWSLGSEIALHEGEFTVEERFDLIDQLGVTVLCQPPSEYRLMAEHEKFEKFYIGSVRHAVSTGAPLDPEIVDTFRVAFGVTIHDGYGQTESGLVVASQQDAEIGVGSLGAPIPGYDIAVIDESGNEQGVGVEGEIALRGRPPSLFAGYWNDPDETKAVFLGEWYLTGDRATRDADGCLWFIGRADGQVSARHEARERAAAAAAEAARVAAAEQARQEEEERTRKADEERRREDTQAAAAAAAAEQARQEEEERTKADEERRREDTQAAAAAAAAEQVRQEEEERTRKADEERRREDTQAAAAATGPAAAATGAAVAERLDREAEAGSPAQPPAEPPAPVKRSRREEAAARRAEKAEAKEAEREKQAADKRRREEEKAAAEQARRDEADAKRAAEAKAREDEQQRKLEENRRREEEKAAADRARSDETDAKRAAQAATAEAARRERESRKSRTPVPAIPDPGDTAEEDGERISAELIARLRAYGHGDSSENALKDQE